MGSSAGCRRGATQPAWRMLAHGPGMHELCSPNSYLTPAATARMLFHFSCTSCTCLLSQEELEALADPEDLEQQELVQEMKAHLKKVGAKAL